MKKIKNYIKFISESYIDSKGNLQNFGIIAFDNFNILGGYYNLDKNTSALIGTSNTDDNITYFFPINDITRKCIFPAMEISDETLNGFNSVNEGSEFIGFNRYRMKKMTYIEFISYENYILSYDPSDMPSGW